ncbi:MAG: LuxR C-terminal-related transcriptional regulator [Shewanella sp.]
MGISAPQLLLVAEQSLQTCMLCNYLAEELKLSIRCLQDPDMWPTLAFAKQDNCVLLIDLATMKPSQLDQWQKLLTKLPQPYMLILLNAETNSDVWMLLTWPNCKGLFFNTDLPEHLANGIKKILQGELWIPRSMLTALYLNQQQPRILVQNGLTAKEIQILDCLRSGFSNHQIANNFFISENTVKSHLYRIFKKISVHNRLQAVKWAQENLRE